MSLDHGVLNIPLAKRGDIDAQIDAFKAARAAQKKAKEKAASLQRAELRTRAKAIVASMTQERINWWAQKCETTPAIVRKSLQSNAYWQPDLIIKAEGGAL
jgi:hypothetical protein